MKIRTFKYMAREGMVNTYRNKLMSFASISVVAASLIIFGIFLLIALNLNYNLRSLTQQPELEVFCRPDLSDEQIDGVEENIKENDKIAEYTIVTKDEALEKAKKIMGENAKLLDGEDSSFMNVSFIIKVRDLADYEKVIEEYKMQSEVESVQYYLDTIQFISRIAYWVQVISAALLVILLVISVFIIANTIKLTVFARRKEIGIMKYIGATDWFIRWPFIIEGILIGLIGAIIAFVLVGYGYSTVENRLGYELLSVGSENFKILNINEVGIQIILIYIAIGMVIGALGSAISIRKYLKV